MILSGIVLFQFFISMMLQRKRKKKNTLLAPLLFQFQDNFIIRFFARPDFSAQAKGFALDIPLKISRIWKPEWFSHSR